MILSDLQELKSYLEIDPDNTAEDRNLYLFLDMASSIIQEFLDRPNLLYKIRTEYYDGTNTDKLSLRCRPVVINPLPQVWVDWAGYYGQAILGENGLGPFDSSTQLVFGQDFCIKLDGVDGENSRSGILQRIRNVWPRPSVRQQGYLTPFIGHDKGSIKVTYGGGYTIDSLPGGIRGAANIIVANLRYMFPLGVELSTEGYEERSISLKKGQRDYLTGCAKPFLITYRNYRFG